MTSGLHVVMMIAGTNKPAAISLLHPIIGVIDMTTSSLSVISNSLLLKRRNAREQPERPSYKLNVISHDMMLVA
ncbi:hypothetical protein SAMN04487958_102386 [Vreelandella subterranea]|uniref:Uncharacterized protein n=1 Tax=Vreelandella subterranea TaxID=416874 RepID=A0A1H9RH55_9GAMM|nr:hypothetical protein SAMN04487958_102386 [Halomonas subterranea]